MFDFAPLKIKQNSRRSDHITRYRIERAGAHPVIVEAASAAEALRKSGVSEPTRIVNLDVERLNLLASGLLQPEEQDIHTSISMDEERLPQFFNAEMGEANSDEEPFEEMSLSSLAEKTQTAEVSSPDFSPPPPSISASTHTAPDPALVKETNDSMSPKATEATASPAMHDVYEIASPVPPLAPPLSANVLETKRELTSEEIDRLLQSDAADPAAES